ncbi:MAG: type II toxin-antitoxin system HicB family antitoxin [Thermodesulfobacteriota bacterium]
MKDRLMYRDFIGSVNYSSDDDVFHGKIEMVDDLVTFEGRSTEELKSAFHRAVDDYVALCEEIHKEPLKTYKGTFNVRIKPALHKKVVEIATIRGVTLNQFVQDSIQRMVTKNTVGRLLVAKRAAKKKTTHGKEKSASNRKTK